MARNLPDTAKRLIRLLREGGRLSDDVYAVVSKIERDMAGRIVAAIKRGASRSEAVAILRKSAAAKKATIIDMVVDAAIEAAANNAKSTADYIEILAKDGTTISIPLLSKSWVTQSFNTPLGKSRITVFDLVEATGITNLRDFRNAIRIAYRDGASSREVASMLEEMVDDIYTPRHRIDAVARTAIHKVASESAMKTYRENDALIKEFIFMATLDERTSDQCMLLDGEVVKKDEADKAPPLHPNCRSTLAPVMIGETADSVKSEMLAASGSSYQDYPTWLAKQAAEKQRSILGARAYGAYAAGGKTKAAFKEALKKAA